jgi:hypothetical protein
VRFAPCARCRRWPRFSFSSEEVHARGHPPSRLSAAVQAACDLTGPGPHGFRVSGSQLIPPVSASMRPVAGDSRRITSSTLSRPSGSTSVRPITSTVSCDVARGPSTSHVFSSENCNQRRVCLGAWGMNSTLGCGDKRSSHVDQLLALQVGHHHHVCSFLLQGEHSLSGFNAWIGQ